MSERLDRIEMQQERNKADIADLITISGNVLQALDGVVVDSRRRNEENRKRDERFEILRQEAIANLKNSDAKLQRPTPRNTKHQSPRRCPRTVREQSNLMENPTNPSNSTTEKKLSATPLRCFTGALTAGTFSLLAYRLTLSIATSFANKPVVSDNPAVVNISAAVRTLVTGSVALGAGVFGIAALGLAALGIQLLFKKATDKQTDTLDDSGSSES